ncbi:MAG: phosphonate metabolism protein/1,5-bisphosphokinase (PRPP-forming) PhnN [Pseudomonadota bacterium]|nr:phosphonate metabolism protein/1,5-bisphosphokinase (PRPP-forming) PhnN [Pseudomonadota bacterium]
MKNHPLNGAAPDRQAVLYYVMGASGAGKDSLIRYAREHLPKGAPIVFAHRYITRRPDAGGENHVALDHREFEVRLRYGCFALSWQAHGRHYGIGVEIDQWLSKGLSVVVSGSRAYFEQATLRYPDLCPVLVRVRHEVLRERLIARHREDEAAIAERLERARELDELKHPQMVVIPNEGPLEEGGDLFVRLLTEQTTDPCA